MAKGIAHRQWTVDFRDYGTVEEARAAVQHEMAMAEHIGERLGVAIVCSPGRERVGDSFVTRGWVFETASIPTVQPGQTIEDVDLDRALGLNEDDAVPAEAA